MCCRLPWPANATLAHPLHSHLTSCLSVHNQFCLSRQDSGELEAAHVFPPAMANEMLGMGTWRLKGAVDACIEFLVQRL